MRALVIEDDPELRMLRRSLGEAIDLRVDAAPDLWPVKIDPHQFENALINLAVNARDASPEARRLQPGIRVIDTTGYAEHAVVHSANLDPDTAVLAKPYRREDLLGEIHAALAGSDD